MTFALAVAASVFMMIAVALPELAQAMAWPVTAAAVVVAVVYEIWVQHHDA